MATTTLGGEITTKGTYLSSNCTTYVVQMSDISQYDAATSNWGDTWRMPTEAECKELIDNCTWRLMTQNGINGYKVTGPNGNYIFLPATGYRNEGLLNSARNYGYYWSSTPPVFDNSAYYLYYTSTMDLRMCTAVVATMV